MNDIALKVSPFFFALILFSCTGEKQKEYKMTIDDFGKIEGQEVVLISLKNNKGNTVRLTNYGATVNWIEVPDRDGNLDNITFGYDSLDDYLTGDPYFGSVVGPYANRIAKGRFKIGDREYKLSINNGENSLHGGPGGWHSVVWNYEIIEKEGMEPAVKFLYDSPDMEEGYPGNMHIEVLYTWTDNNDLVIEYRCSSDKATVLNITNHAYFNLKGAGKGDILDHLLQIRASEFTPVDSELIPTGEILSVDGTPFDFREPHRIGERINQDSEQLILGMGYDHNFVLDNDIEPDAIVYEESSGRLMEMFTDQPGVQFYCGNFLDGSEKGHGGRAYEYRGGFCLETQHFPDSPNQENFPSTLIEPGQIFETKTIYRFSTR